MDSNSWWLFPMTFLIGLVLLGKSTGNYDFYHQTSGNYDFLPSNMGLSGFNFPNKTDPKTFINSAQGTSMAPSTVVPRSTLCCRCVSCSAKTVAFSVAFNLSTWRERPEIPGDSG